MKGDVTLENLNLLRHFVMRADKLLGILRLVVQLGCQLMILENGETSLGLQLFVIQSHQVCLSLFHLEVHLLCQFLHIFDFFELCFIDCNHALLLLALVLDLEPRYLVLHLFFVVAVFFIFDQVGFESVVVALKKIELSFELFPGSLEILLLILILLHIRLYLLRCHSFQ